MNIGNTIFENQQSQKYVINGFLIVYRFDNSTTPTGNDIRTGIYNKTLVFSPTGSLYQTSSGNGSVLFTNPLTESAGETYQRSWNGAQLDPSRFSKYINSVPEPSYYVSLSNDGNGAGWILYEEENSGNYVYYLLQNPMNRNNEVNNSDTYGAYCSAIQFQDPGCYCNNLSGQPHRCTFAYLRSETAAKTLLDEVSDQNAVSLQTVEAQCGCNSICKEWDGYNTLINKPDCSSISNLTFCSVGLSAESGGIINTAGLNVTQDCSNKPSGTPPSGSSSGSPPPGTPPSGSPPSGSSSGSPPPGTPPPGSSTGSPTKNYRPMLYIGLIIVGIIVVGVFIKFYIEKNK